MIRAELKSEAKKQLRGNWGWAVWFGLVMLIINAILFGSNYSSYVKTANDFNDALGNANAGSFFDPSIWAGRLGTGSGMSFLGGFFMLSMVITFLHFANGQKFSISKGIFSVFTEGRFVPELLNYLLSYIFQYLWTLLLIIPGWIKSYSYALTPYIVSDMVESGKEVGPTTGISESRKLMDGHKWELFVLDLSFIGWEILAFLTLGIGFIWLAPYIQVTKANFYRNIAGDQFLH